MKRPLRAGMIAAVASVAALLPLRAVWADLAPADAVVEAMMTSQEADMIEVQRLFGPDLATPLVFSSAIDVTNQTFSYSTVPNSTYQGLPFTLTTSGAFNSGINTWLWSVAGSRGGSSWTGDGSELVGPNLTFAGAVHFKVPNDTTDWNVEITKTVEVDAANLTMQSTELCWLTIGDAAVSIKWIATNNGPLQAPAVPEEPPYSWNMGGTQPNGITLAATGLSGITGNSGVFAGQFAVTQSAPEPGSISLLSLGFVVLMGRAGMLSARRRMVGKP